MYCAYAVMLALRVKDRTGEGQQVDISMMEGQLALLGTAIANYFANGDVPKPIGNGLFVVAALSDFPHQNTRLALAIAGEKALAQILSG
jgi:formyl-CoA transferase/CoA:oxalate CoA-transferase